MVVLKDICGYMYPRRWDKGDRELWEAAQPRADRTVCSVRKVGVVGETFTMVQYNGPDAREVC